MTKGMALFLAGSVVTGCSNAPAPVPVSAATESTAGHHAKRSTLSGRGPVGTLIVAEPLFEHESPPTARAAVMDQSGRTFLPQFLTAMTGQLVEFRSSEEELHNVRVAHTGTKAPVFNIAILPFGKYEYTFDEPGLYDVTCDIHPEMKATVLIATTPYMMVSDDRGAFSFDGLVPGSYKVTALSGTGPVEKTVEVTAAATTVSLP